MGCDPITFRGVNANVIDNIKQKLTGYGINVPSGNEGEMEGYGVKGHFKWDGAETLTLTITDKPVIISCGMIKNKMQDFIGSYSGVSLVSPVQ